METENFSAVSFLIGSFTNRFNGHNSLDSLRIEWIDVECGNELELRCDSEASGKKIQFHHFFD